MQRNVFSTLIEGALVALPFGNLATGDGQAFDVDVALTGSFVTQFTFPMKAGEQCGYLALLTIDASVLGTIFVGIGPTAGSCSGTFFHASNQQSAVGPVLGLATFGVGFIQSAVPHSTTGAHASIVVGTAQGFTADCNLRFTAAYTVGTAVLKAGSALYAWKIRTKG